MLHSPTYKFEQFGNGDVYSASVDYRRFITLDYNLSRYVGFIGDGITSGWDIQTTGGLGILITPGTGIINSLYSDTKWIQPPIRRSTVNPVTQTIIKEIPAWSNPDPTQWDGAFFNVGGSQPEQALALVQLGPDGEKDSNGNVVVPRPHYGPTPEITFEDPYVEAVNNADSSLTLADNRDNYVYAVRVNGAYDPAVTFVGFQSTVSEVPIANSVLLGKIVVRSGAVVSVDLSRSPRGFGSLIASLASKPIQQHHHNGQPPYNPPQILLNTDIRDAIPWNKDSTGNITYQILDNRITSSVSGHSHTYYVVNGVGSTVDLIGNGAFHYHKIINGVIGEPVANLGVVIGAHTHTIDNSPEAWTDRGAVLVYRNGNLVPSTSYSIDLNSKQIAFKPGSVSVSQNLYKASFKLLDGTTYEFSGQFSSLYLFLVHLIGDFDSKYFDQTQFWDSNGNPIKATIRSPFDFYTFGGNNAEPGADGFYLSDPVFVDELPTGTPLGRDPDPPLNIGGFQDTLDQSKMGAALLRKAGDVFTLLPGAGRYVDIVLEAPAAADAVYIEIVQNSEVTGQILPGSIAFLSANNIVNGSFRTTQIPLLGHGGRFGEIFKPLVSSTQTKNGASYYVTPSWTENTDGHSHQVIADRLGNGTTVATIVNDKAVTTVDGVNINHSHAVKGFVVAGVVGSGVNLWQNLAVDAIHTHELDLQVPGDSKSVFSIAASGSDNWIGTSDGLMFWPAAYALKYTFQGAVYRRLASDGVSGLLTALQDHLVLTQNSIVIADPTAVATVLSGISAVGETATVAAILQGATPSIVNISVEGISEFVLDDFSATKVLRFQELTDEDEVLATFVVLSGDNLSAGASYGQCAASSANAIGITDPKMVETVYFTTHNFQNEPCWGVEVVGSQVLALTPTRVVVYNAGKWSSAEFPSMFQTTRNLAIGSDSTAWVTTDRGLFQMPLGLGYFIGVATGSSKNMSWILANSSRLILAAADGIWISDDNGITWTKTSAVSCLQICLDSGSALYALSSDQSVYQSSDNGSSWTKTGSAPTLYGAIGKIFVHSSKLFVATEKDILHSDDSGASWVPSLLGKKARSFAIEGATFYTGSDNAIYSWDGTAFSLVKNLNGSPVAAFWVDGSPQNFWIAWSNYSSGVFFSYPPGINSRVTGAFTFDLWQDPQGSWNAASPIDVYINGQTILSTNQNIDRRQTVGPDFNVQAADGRLDFGIRRQVVSSALATDTSLFVDSTEGIQAGNALVILPSAIRCKVKSILNSRAVKLEDPIGQSISAGAVVKVAGAVGGDLIVSADIYDSPLINSGKFSHAELEDQLSLGSTGSPLSVSNDFLNNFNQLVLRLKESSPTIDSVLKKWKAYMMRFSNVSTSPDYIDNFFNTVQSNLLSGSQMKTVLGPLQSTVVHSVAVGYGDYAGTIFAGTDAGLFIAPFDINLKGNWCLVPGCPAGEIYDIVFAPEKVIVAGSNGLYRSTSDDLSTWEVVASQVVESPRAVLWRWANFGLPDGESWWKSWDGYTNLKDPDITNTMVSAGINQVAVSKDNGNTWTQSALPYGSFSSSFVQPISDGSAILGLNQISGTYGALVSSTDNGETWPRIINIFNGYSGAPIKVGVTAQGHTALTFNPNSFPFFPDHYLDGSQLTTPGFSWLIISNQSNTLVVQGEAAGVVSTDTVCSLAHLQINAIAQTEKGLILGSSNGIFEDRGLYSSSRQFGTIAAVNFGATVTGVDVQGTIRNIAHLPNGTTKLLCTLSQNVGSDELVGRSLQVSGGMPSPTIGFITPTPGQTVSSSSATVVFSVQSFDIGNSGYISMSVDQQPAQYLSTPTTELTGLNAGPHAIEAHLVDPNRSEIVGTSITTVFNTTYSPTAPSVAVTYPANAQSVSTSSFVAVFSVTNFALGVAGQLFYSLDGGTPTIVIPPSSSLISPTATLANIPAGAHTLQATLQNLSGTTIATSLVNFSVVVGSQPSIQIVSPNNTVPPQVIPSKSLTVSYNVSMFTPGTTGNILVKLDGVAVATTSNSSSFTLSGLTDGTHTVVLQLSDSNGPLPYSASTATVTVLVNSTVATTPSLAVSGPTAFSPAAFLPIQFVATNFVVGIDGGILVKINGGPAIFWTTNAPYQVPDGAVGTIQVSATLASDANTPLLNVEATKNFQITVSAQPLGLHAPAAPSTVMGLSTSAPTAGNKALKAPNVSLPAPPMTWLVLSNTPSTLTQDSEVVVQGNIQTNVVNATVQIAGTTNAVLYVTFDQPTPAGTYDKGWIYVDAGEFNGGKTYDIIKQTTGSITVSGPIVSGKSNDVQTGQPVTLIPPSGDTVIAVNFNQVWGENELRGNVVKIISSLTASNTNNEVFPVVSNTPRSITIAKANPSLFQVGDPLVLLTVPFSPLLSFNSTQTSVDEDHWHEVSMVGGFVQGSISGMTKTNPTTVRLTCVSTGLSNPILIGYPNLLAGAKLVLASQKYPEIIYEETIVSTDSAHIFVAINDVSHWDFAAEDNGGIDSSFRWTIDGRRYGVTSALHYKRFSAYSSPLSIDANIGALGVTVSDGSGFVVGDAIQVVDARPAAQLAKITSITGNVLTLDQQVSQNFLVNNDAQVKALRDAFGGGNHSHFIYDGEPSSQSVAGYQNLGYALQHTHGLVHRIQNVTEAIQLWGSGRVVVGGNDTRMQFSDNAGSTWGTLLDAATVTGENGVITDITQSPQGYLMAGTGNGLVVGEGFGDLTTQPLKYVPSTDAMPSSSSSFSSSSSSLSSFSSQSISNSSFSSSSTSSASSMSSKSV